MIYYSHSKHIYDTFREYEELKWLTRKFGCVICPNNDLGYFDIVNSHTDIIKNCEKLVLSELYGSIGKGVYGQVIIALSIEIQVLVLRKIKDKYELFEVQSVRVTDPDDWASTRYGKVVTI